VSRGVLAPVEAADHPVHANASQIYHPLSRILLRVLCDLCGKFWFEVVFKPFAGTPTVGENTMRKISSSLTFFNKRVFPTIWFGFLSIFLVMALVQVWQKAAPPFILLIPLVMMGFGYFIMKMLVFDLMDEVYLGNDQIIVRNRGEEDSFPVTNILNVDSTAMTNPPRITLTLRQPCKFGDTLTFSPPTRWWPFSRDPIALELIRLAHGLDDPTGRTRY
jgi:hypothetical protein